MFKSHKFQIRTCYALSFCYYPCHLIQRKSISKLWLVTLRQFLLLYSIKCAVYIFFCTFFSRGSVSLCWGLLPSPRRNWTSVTTSSSWCRDRSSCCRRSLLRLMVSSLSSITSQVSFFLTCYCAII